MTTTYRPLPPVTDAPGTLTVRAGELLLSPLTNREVDRRTTASGEVTAADAVWGFHHQGNPNHGRFLAHLAAFRVLYIADGQRIQSSVFPPGVIFEATR